MLDRSPGSREIVQVDDLRIDLARRRVYRGDTEVPMSALSFTTLAALIQAAPDPVSVAQLIERAWQGTVVSDAAVTQRIRLLRQALNDNTRQPRYIETLRSAGYRLVPPVQTAEPAASDHQHRPPPRWRHTAVPIAVAVIAAAVVAVAAFRPSIPAESPAPSESSAIPQGPVTAAEMVAKARDLVRHQDPSSLNLAIGLLRRAATLKPDDPSIRSALALALARSVAWYEGPFETARQAEMMARAALEEQVSASAELAVALSLDAQGKVAPAQAAYERAMALDPKHWGARASVAYLLQVQGRLFEALAHNLAAMELGGARYLDVQVADCLRLLGFDAIASQWLHRADQLHPASAHAAPSRAHDLVARGQLEKAEVVIDAAIARGVLRQSELYEYRAVIALRRGDLPAARAAFDDVPKTIRRLKIDTWLGIIDGLEGDAAAARARIAQLLAFWGDENTWPSNQLYIALLQVAAGHDQKALDALTRLFADGYRDHRWLESLPPFAHLVRHPEFMRIIDAMRDDVERQRAKVMVAPWLPKTLRRSMAVSRPPRSARNSE